MCHAENTPRERLKRAQVTVEGGRRQTPWVATSSASSDHHKESPAFQRKSVPRRQWIGDQFIKKKERKEPTGVGGHVEGSRTGSPPPLSYTQTQLSTAVSLPPPPFPHCFLPASSDRHGSLIPRRLVPPTFLFSFTATPAPDSGGAIEQEKHTVRFKGPSVEIWDVYPLEGGRGRGDTRWPGGTEGQALLGEDVGEISWKMEDDRGKHG